MDGVRGMRKEKNGGTPVYHDLVFFLKMCCNNIKEMNYETEHLKEAIWQLMNVRYVVWA
jgi:hypothetical protein